MNKKSSFHFKLSAISFVLCLVLVITGLSAAEPPALAVKAGKIITVSGKTILNGTILIKDGKIEKVGAGLTVPGGYKVLDYPEGVVYPGLIDGLTMTGLHTDGFVRQSADIRETGDYNPQLRAADAFYSWAKSPLVLRDYGILTVMSAPSGGTISGKASIADLDGWTPAEMITVPEAALIIELPRSPQKERFDMDKEAKRYKTAVKKHGKKMKELDRFMAAARSYYLRDKSGLPNDFNKKYQAMKPVWGKKLPVIIKANSAENIRAAIKLGKKHKLNAVLSGVYDAEGAIKELKASGYPVILDQIGRGNRQWADGYNKMFRLPGVLSRAGVMFAFSDYSILNPSDFVMQAGVAVAHGLDRAEALKALTLYPAKILGIASHGSIEPGKTANLFIASGDIFDTSTTIEAVIVKGKLPKAESYFKKEYQRTLKEKYNK